MRPRPIGLLCLAAVPWMGCGEPYGSVTLSWQFVDRSGTRIFPGGLFDRGGFARDSCGLPGETSQGPTSYDLGVALEICDPACELGCADPACHVQPPVVFGCDAYRGTDPEVPASDDPYRFTLRPVLDIELTQARCLTPSPSCVAVPGPRDRTLHPGLMVDLQVYQIVLDVNDPSGDPLNLETCGCV